MKCAVHRYVGFRRVTLWLRRQPHFDGSGNRRNSRRVNQPLLGLSFQAPRPETILVYGGMQPFSSFALKDTASERAVKMAHCSIRDSATLLPISRIVVVADLLKSFLIKMDGANLDCVSGLGSRRLLRWFWVKARSLIKGERTGKRIDCWPYACRYHGNAAREDLDGRLGSELWPTQSFPWRTIYSKSARTRKLWMQNTYTRMAYVAAADWFPISSSISGCCCEKVQLKEADMVPLQGQPPFRGSVSMKQVS